jgi:hypothetical protein
MGTLDTYQSSSSNSVRSGKKSLGSQHGQYTQGSTIEEGVTLEHDHRVLIYAPCYRLLSRWRDHRNEGVQVPDYRYLSAYMTIR